MAEKLLEFRNVSKVYKVGGGLGLFGAKYVRAISNINFSMLSDKPRITALVGESGSGKTTIAKLVLGLLEPSTGQVIYKNKDVREWTRGNVLEFWREVQAVFQDPYSVYNPFYRVDHALWTVIKKFKLADSPAEGREMIIDAMRRLGMRPEDILGRYPHQLSGGERQRLMLVRAFLIKPRLLVADEPVSMIDASLRAIFLNNLLDLKNSLKLSCLYITHDLTIANYISDEAIVLCYGKIVEMGDTRAIVSQPLHPYSQLLINSIAIPNPQKRWKDELRLESHVLRELRAETGCVFRHRCPYALPICEKDDPPLMNVNGREVACFLYSGEESFKH